MNKQIQLCFEILGRYFPEQSSRVEEAREQFNIPAGEEVSNAYWKQCACNYLATHLSVKRTKKSASK